MNPNSLLKALCVLLFLSLNTQANAQNDIVTLVDGTKMECRIVRVGSKTLYYHGTRDTKINKVKMDEVTDYEFNGVILGTGPTGRLEHTKVVEVAGFSKDEIYRALEDWYIVNSRRLYDGVYIADYKHSAIRGTFSTNGILPLQLDVILAAFSASGQGDENTYFNYDVMVRAKDGRFKVIFTNFRVENEAMKMSKTLKEVYGKKRHKNGDVTMVGLEIAKMQDYIKAQIKAVSGHCEYVRQYDTLRGAFIRYITIDDDW